MKLVRRIASSGPAPILRERGQADGNGGTARALDTLGLSPRTGGGERTPFLGEVISLGVEHELAAAVAGQASRVDQPLVIAESNYYQNLLRRQAAGETPRWAVCELSDWLNRNRDGVWEHSWARLPLASLSGTAAAMWERDLARDKSRPEDGQRTDRDRFFCRLDGAPAIRVPVSYLLRLSLAGAADALPPGAEDLAPVASKLADHFISDNTSPETHSFYVSDYAPGQGPHGSVLENAQRHLLSLLLLKRAELAHGLAESGQRPMVYFSPQPPSRLAELSAMVSDSFYRELFMNPCLAGWERGEEKHQYMHLCHQVLSRAQWNSLIRLKEAGIIPGNLVALPSASNISLANNGTHVSLGSPRLAKAVAAAGPAGAAAEKRLGDLAIKIVEHFLPLMVGTVSAAPARLGFPEMRPEKALRFLPFELHPMHLRMIWRRWRKKARIKAQPFGVRLSPSGQPTVDRVLAGVFGLAGDFLPDFRLLDYLAACLATPMSPALDGRLGNQARLKQDLAAQGVFHPDMPLYLLFRQRLLAERGFAGFEARHISLMPGLAEDFSLALELCALFTSLGFHLAVSGQLKHHDLPDDPMSESERRQIFFGAAIGLPTFFVRQETPNTLIKDILALTPGIRPSRRYPGFWRVRQQDFRLGLLEFIETKGAAVLAANQAHGVLARLRARLEDPAQSALSRLDRGVRDRLGVSDPLKAPAGDYNRAAEAYYREDLAAAHLEEALALVAKDLEDAPLSDRGREVARALCGADQTARVFGALGNEFSAGRIGREGVGKLIALTVLNIAERGHLYASHGRTASIHRAALG